MKNRSFSKNIAREIKSSFGRFFAIFAIVALGVGFFSGLKVTTKAMLKTTQNYYSNTEFYDFKLVSTLGFEKTDVEYLKSNISAQAVSPSNTVDILYDADNGLAQVVRTHSITEDINKITIVSGRLPLSSDECVVDSKNFKSNSVGKTIKISDSNNSDDVNKFSYKEYKIVGLVKSPLYIQFERGTSSIGNGSVYGFAYLLPTGYNIDYFSEIYIKLENRYEIYSQKYKDFIDKTKSEIDPTVKQVCDSRYDRIYNSANVEINNAQNDIDINQKKLNDSMLELDKNVSDWENRTKEVNDKEKDLIVSKNSIQQGLKEIEAQKSNLLIKKEEYDLNLNNYNISLDKLNNEKNNYTMLLDSLNSQYNGYDNIPEEVKKQNNLDEISNNINSKDLQLKEVKAKLDETQNQLAGYEEVINNKNSELQNNLTDIDKGLNDITSAKSTLQNSLEKINLAKEDIEKGKSEIKNAQDVVDEKRTDLNNLGENKVFILGRDTNVGYVCFENDSNIVDGIADIFPVFFFCVAVLVCITTMTRMIDEERTQIGIFKALGFNQRTITSKYLIYSGGAAISGCIFGYFAGTYAFPKVIWSTYKIMYIVDKLKYVFDVKLAVISLLVAFTCSVVVTLINCNKELTEVPAQLIRPKSPKPGKRVLLEHIPLIWKKLKFLHKVSYRNIFRYKKRLYMMVLGISGCTALLVTGFGIRDSIANVANQQFENIDIYDVQLNFLSPLENQMNEIDNDLKDNIMDYDYALQKSMNFKFKNGNKSTNLIVMDNKSDTEKYINLHTKSGEKISFPGTNECVINEKTAKQNKLKIGDEITLEDDVYNTIKATISGINQNYLFNYVYLSRDTYVNQTGDKEGFKTVFINLKNGVDTHKVGATLMKIKNASSISVNSDIRDRFSNMIKSLNLIVLVVILCAAGLAFVVLYNLTNININERIREISTIKVLGFTKSETQAYVFRENVILTLIGTAVGLFLGVGLHYLVMTKISLDVVNFGINIKSVSFVYSAVLTVAFSLLINFGMGFKLDKINMAESLKSVE